MDFNFGTWEYQIVMQDFETRFRESNFVQLNPLYVVKFFVTMYLFIYLKWGNIFNWEIWNTSCGKLNSWESNCQFIFWALLIDKSNSSNLGAWYVVGMLFSKATTLLLRDFESKSTWKSWTPQVARLITW